MTTVSFQESSLSSSVNSLKEQGKTGFRLFIKTYGCQANVYDSQRMEWALRPLGFFMEEDPRRAHVVIVNTCHIRLKAEEKLFSDLGRLRRVKEEKTKKGEAFILVVAGCVGQALGEQILKRAPFVDVLVGPQTYHTLPETLMKLIWEKKLEPQTWIEGQDIEDSPIFIEDDDNQENSSPNSENYEHHNLKEKVHNNGHHENQKHPGFNNLNIQKSSQVLEKSSCCGDNSCGSTKASSACSSLSSIQGDSSSKTLMGKWVIGSEPEKIPQNSSCSDMCSSESSNIPQENPQEAQKIKKAPKEKPVFYTALGFPKMEKFDELPQVGGLKGPTAFLSIQEGCNKFCRFCVVPYVRGPEYSRSPESILREAENLVTCGAKEITLLGQNVNAYHGEDEKGISWSLGRLLFALGEIPGLLRLRYTTSHPRDMHQELYEAHRDVPQVMPFLHLPVQSGSNKILAHMNRKYTQEEYLRIIEDCRSYCPTIGFSSDFIVGYPGETDGDFNETLNLVEAVGFAQGFSFKYSPRPGTPAATMKQVEEKVKEERLQQLQHLLNAQRLSFNNSFLHKDLELLVEYNHRETQEFVGRSLFMQPVTISMLFHDVSSLKLGDVVDVQITHSSTNTMVGVLSSRK